MTGPRVFAVSEPQRFDGRSWVRSVDLRPAQQHGELVFLMPPGNEGSADPAVAIATLTEKLADFGEADFLLPVGHPLYIAWAAAIAARQTGGTLNLLHWQQRDRFYAVVRSRVFQDQPRELEQVA